MRDSYDLQGLGGTRKLAAGQTFAATGSTYSRGFQVVKSGSFDYTVVAPGDNQTTTFSSVVLDPPSFIGGAVLELTTADGEAAVFPTTSTGFDIT